MFSVARAVFFKVIFEDFIVFKSMQTANPKRAKVVLLILLGLINYSGFSQTNDGPYLQNYYYDYKLSNPSFVGNEAKHTITTTFSGYLSNESSYYSGKNQTFLASYEAKLKKIKSGIGGGLIKDELGFETKVEASLLLSHQFNLTKTSGLQVGTQLQLSRTKIDGKYYRYIDNEDPLIVEGKESGQKLNLGVGLNYYSSYFTLGIAYKNIKANDFGYDSVRHNSDAINLILFRKIKLNNWLNITPSVFHFTDLSHHATFINNTFQIKKWILVGAGYRIPQQDNGNFTFNIGANIKDYVQVITHIYSYENRLHSDHHNNKHFIETMILVKIP